MGVRGAQILSLVLSLGLGSTVRGQIPFTEEAELRGVEFFLYTGSIGWGRGFALNDLDGDGDLDLALTGDLIEAVTFYENQGDGTFELATPGGLPAASQYGGLCAADYDADGDLDLYVSNFVGPNLLLRNDGDLQFSDVSVESGLADPGHTVGCSWGDFDNDGWADLYVVNRSPALIENNHLYRNLGDGSFVDVSDILGPPELGPSCQGVFFDYDRDADVDLFLSNDKGNLGYQCRMWRNDGSAMPDVSTFSGAGVFAHAMGVGVGDPNLDGDLDLFISNTPIGGDNILLLNQGDGTFQDASVEYGITEVAVGWASEFFDFDNDGIEDLYTSDGNSTVANRLYRGSLTPPLQDIAAVLDLDLSAATFCAVPGDIDGDGDLDLVVSSTNWPLEIYINHEGETRNWIAVDLWSDTPNTRALGAIVDLEAGGVSQTRTVLGTNSYKCAKPYTLHFGLGDATSVESITVHWPGGAISSHGPFDAGQTVTLDDSGAITPEAVFIRGDVNSDGEFDIADPVLGLSHLFLGESIACLRSLDANSDGTLNVADAVFSLSALFGMGSAPSAPHPDCGSAGGSSSLSCESSPGCP